MFVNYNQFISWLYEIPRRSRRAIRPALVSALAGLVAWPISYYFMGHELPLFATITAIVCLAPGIPNHGSQSILVVLGVSIGFLLAELILLSHLKLLFSIPIATFAGMLVAASFGFRPVVSTQASVTAILILAFGTQTAGFNRLIDVSIGACVALFFSQVLFTPNPMRGLITAKNNFFERVITALNHGKDALIKQQSQTARTGTKVIINAHQHLAVFNDAINVALHHTKWSLRGQLALNKVKNMANHYDRRVIRLYAAAVLLCESIVDGLRRHERGEITPPPSLLIEEVQQLINELNQFIEHLPHNITFHPIKSLTPQTQPSLDETDPWNRCFMRLKDVQYILKRITVNPGQKYPNK